MLEVPAFLHVFEKVTFEIKFMRKNIKGDTDVTRVTFQVLFLKLSFIFNCLNEVGGPMCQKFECLTFVGLTIFHVNILNFECHIVHYF